MIRNRFHLWVFLSKNPALQSYRAKPMQECDESSDGDSSSNRGTHISDLEAAKAELMPRVSIVDEEDYGKLSFYNFYNMFL